MQRSFARTSAAGLQHTASSAKFDGLGLGFRQVGDVVRVQDFGGQGLEQKP